LSDIKHPVLYKDEYVEAYLEIAEDGRAFIHCYINKWSKDVYGKLTDIWIEAAGALADKGLDTIYAGVTDKKLIKFAEMFGFVLTDEYYEDNRHEVRRIMKC